jgi:hypothetical protein
MPVSTPRTPSGAAARGRGIAAAAGGGGGGGSPAHGRQRRRHRVPSPRCSFARQAAAEAGRRAERRCVQAPKRRCATAAGGLYALRDAARGE